MKTKTVVRKYSSGPLSILLCSSALLLASCGSGGSSRPPLVAQGQSNAADVVSLQSKIDELSDQLEQARKEIREVRALSEEARAAADIAQSQAAASEDRIDAMFKRSVFK